MNLLNLHKKQDTTIIRIAAYAAFIIPFFVMLLKITVCMMTGSLSVQASFIDSASDLISSAVMIISIYISQKPANKIFQYGFGKVEALGALIQSVFIFASGIFVCLEAYESIVFNEEVRFSFTALSLIVFSSLLLFSLTKLQKYVIKRTDSLIIKASCIHFHMDILLDLGVMASLCINHLFGMHYIDSIFGLLFTMYIFRNSFSIMMKSFEVLLDKSMSEDQTNEIRKILQNTPKVMHIAEIRTRFSGLKKIIMISIYLNPSLTIAETDEIKKQIITKITDIHKDSLILIDTSAFDENKIASSNENNKNHANSDSENSCDSLSEISEHMHSHSH